LAASARVSASTSLTVVDSSASVSVELWPGGPGTVAPDADGLLVHTNHFLSTPARHGDTSTGSGSDSRARYAALRRRFAGRGAGVTSADAFAALADHDGGVCRHPDPVAPAGERYATLATITLDLTAAALHIRAGPPCRAAGD
jgi:isopenicillin-N N-acyltransferase-like protein